MELQREFYNKLYKINTYEDFVSVLKSIQSEKEQIDFIMNWFLNCVEYDYVTLEYANVKEEDIEKIDEIFDCEDEKQRKEAFQYAHDFFYYSSGLLERVSKHYGEKYIIPARKEINWFGKIIPGKEEVQGIRTFSQAMNMCEKPVKYQNGLIVKGVCADYAEFIKRICDDLEIECSVVHGHTKVGHVWNKINNMNYDITYAIFVRDKFGGWNKEFVMFDWLGIDDKKLIEMQPNRIIEKIGDMILDKPININNFVKKSKK